MSYKRDRLMARAAKRRAEMRRMREDRHSYKAIGQKFGISWQRVQQILHPKASE